MGNERDEARGGDGRASTSEDGERRGVDGERCGV